MRKDIFKHLKEFIQDMIELYNTREKEHERVYSELLEKYVDNNTKENTNAESYSNTSNELSDINYFPEPSHYNPYSNTAQISSRRPSE